VAVTVLHESTMLADAWATALLVVGEHDARSLIKQQGLSAQLTERIDGRFAVYRTPSFESLVLRH
jgi:thiamine biosynthesis lipoprotein